ncbi:MAG TPA: GspE/PulE family protein [Isosphaeraceae bacterium]|jgi:type II secretory ATPase GspE/PulE/Tfp pilus assembly ATPase PilB-like protein|nr:GspE/PulE family protein [Isosphaeraceae bacterium]
MTNDSPTFRPRPALLAAAALVLALGHAGAAAAAEPIGLLLAQTADTTRGAGNYINWFKFVPIIFIYLIWAWMTYWVSEDTRELENPKYGYWTTAVFLSGVLGLALVFVVPFYAVGLVLALLLVFAPVLVYVGVRNQGIHHEDKVLTPYHLGEVANDLMRKAGMKGPFNRPVKADEGPPVTFVPKGAMLAKTDPELIEQALQAEAIFGAKDLIYDAVVRRATDVLLEPDGEQMTIRYRIDGILHAAEPFDRESGDAVINIFKVFSGLDINERRKPQEGTFGAKVEKREADFRVATSGSRAGENMVLRVTDTTAAITKLEETGLRPKLAERLREIVTQKQGLILCCGTPGSGKSATAYACLRSVDRYQHNLYTIEDRIEQTIDNVTQSEVDVKKGESYPEKLRSVLRQDPDLIFVGELKDRDQETASILCQAATTGHIVLTTMQAGETVEALFKLIDMGIEQHTLASGLGAIVAQRLVRLLCETCKEPYKPKPEAIRKLNLPADKIDVFYRPPKEPDPEVGPCPDCGGTGYLGRTGIFEVLDVTEPIRELIRENPSANAIRAEARKNGMIYLQEDGMRQVIQGRTSIDELRRVVK